MTKDPVYHLLRLSLACNVKCKFCNIPPETAGFVDLDCDSAKKKIASLTEGGVRANLSLTGGEPTLRKDLPELISFAKQSGVEVVEIQTNAVLCRDKSLVEKLRLAGLDKVFVSLHSHFPAIHDDLMQCQGAFESALAGIANLASAGIEITINHVITSENYQFFRSLFFF
jgi:GTP 3',8-cyclase